MKSKCVFDILVINNDIFTREFIQLRDIGFDLLVLDSEPNYESY